MKNAIGISLKDVGYECEIIKTFYECQDEMKIGHVELKVLNTNSFDKMTFLNYVRAIIKNSLMAQDYTFKEFTPILKDYGNYYHFTFIFKLEPVIIRDMTDRMKREFEYSLSKTLNDTYRLDTVKYVLDWTNTFVILRLYFRDTRCNYDGLKDIMLKLLTDYGFSIDDSNYLLNSDDDDNINVLFVGDLPNRAY